MVTSDIVYRGHCRFSSYCSFPRIISLNNGVSFLGHSRRRFQHFTFLSFFFLVCQLFPIAVDNYLFIYLYSKIFPNFCKI